jgi:hypothetical protein
MPSRLVVALLAMAGIVPAPFAAHAAWPHDPYTGNVAISNASSYQVSPNALSDGAGGAFIAFSDGHLGSYDVFVQRINATGTPLWTSGGIGICTAAANQLNVQGVPDGAGGVIYVWEDNRSGNTDIYAQRVNANGVGLWTASGIAVCNLATTQTAPQLCTDGAGGAIITWMDYRGGGADIFAQRLNSSGTALWTLNGVAVCAAANDQLNPQIASDGAAGAIIAWGDTRTGTADIYAQRVSGVGGMLWAANGVGVCTAANNQVSARIIASPGNSAIVAWYDYRSGATWDIYAQHLNPSGGGDWGANGVPVSVAAGDQTSPYLCTDDAGGAIIAWQDLRGGSNADVYAQRMLVNGQAAWTADGVAVCTATGDQTPYTLEPDGANGAIIGWLDLRSGISADVYAQRVNASGTSQWAFNGTPICAALNSQTGLACDTDGAGGAIFAWDDQRNGTANDHIYAQRVDFYGQLGNAEPTSAGIKDVPNDQGGQVKVGWNASYLDDAPTYGIVDYRVWRSVPPNSAPARARLARGVTTDPDEAAATGGLLSHRFGVDTYLWELVGSQTANQLPGYSMVTATVGDSVGGSNPRTAFMVEARASTSVSGARWYSAPDSGYSVDNLAPNAPAPFTGQYASGTSHLHWNPNTEADLAGYELYRGTSVSFTPGPGNLVASLPDTGYADAAGAPYVYKLTAIDVHGNESVVATLVPGGTTAVDGESPARSFFALASANPVRGDATMRFGLASAGHVTLTLYDASGRRVRELPTTRVPPASTR